MVGGGFIDIGAPRGEEGGGALLHGAGRPPGPRGAAGGASSDGRTNK